jgi:hypothetical protein
MPISNIGNDLLSKKRWNIKWLNWSEKAEEL